VTPFPIAPIAAPAPLTSSAPSLREAISPHRVVFLPELQGRTTNLSTCLTEREGYLTAVAQWTSTEDPDVKRLAVGVGDLGVSRVLTLAARAVAGGFA
jgi:hypothetical protein